MWEDYPIHQSYVHIMFRSRSRSRWGQFLKIQFTNRARNGHNPAKPPYPNLHKIVSGLFTGHCITVSLYLLFTILIRICLGNVTNARVWRPWSRGHDGLRLTEQSGWAGVGAVGVNIQIINSSRLPVCWPGVHWSPAAYRGVSRVRSAHAPQLSTSPALHQIRCRHWAQ